MRSNIILLVYISYSFIYNWILAVTEIPAEIYWQLHKNVFSYVSLNKDKHFHIQYNCQSYRLHCRVIAHKSLLQFKWFYRITNNITQKISTDLIWKPKWQPTLCTIFSIPSLSLKHIGTSFLLELWIYEKTVHIWCKNVPFAARKNSCKWHELLFPMVVAICLFVYERTALILPRA